jgi:trk system potassium uptake protein TrkA
MKVIVVGCGRFGSELAYRLFQSGHEVAIVDAIPEAFNILPVDFRGRLIEGDALNQDVLHRAGIEHADAVAATSDNDAMNLAVVHIASRLYNVKRVVARNYDPKLRHIFDQFGVQMVSSSLWGSQRIEELIYHSEVRTVFSAGNGEVEIYEVYIPADLAGKKVKDIFGIPGCSVAAITRAGKAQMPDMEFVLEEDDLVHVSATFDGIREVRLRVCAPGEK